MLLPSSTAPLNMLQGWLDSWPFCTFVYLSRSRSSIDNGPWNIRADRYHSRLAIDGTTSQESIICDTICSNGVRHHNRIRSCTCCNRHLLLTDSVPDAYIIVRFSRSSFPRGAIVICCVSDILVQLRAELRSLLQSDNCFLSESNSSACLTSNSSPPLNSNFVHPLQAPRVVNVGVVDLLSFRTLVGQPVNFWNKPYGEAQGTGNPNLVDDRVESGAVLEFN